MQKLRIARIAGIAAAVAFALSAVAPVAQAVTTADLQAQIAMLMAQLQTLQGGSSSASASVTFTRSLTVGSTGSDVTALQNWLISKGFTISAGATGYFGAQTKAAVARWQASAGISPAAGFFGPISRSAVNAMAGGTTGSTGGTTTGGTSTTGGTTGSTGTITTPGVEGVLTVTAGPISNTVANVGQTMVPVLTVRAQAQTSDIAIQRVTLDLGTNTAIYNKIFSKVYVVDNASGTVLASAALNSSTVVQSGSDYVVTLSGFSVVVPRGTYKDLGIKADLYSSIDSVYLTGGVSAVTDTFMVPINGVRGIDGAGIDQYGPAGSISQTITVNRSLIDNSSAQVSISASTPLANTVPVTDTTNGQILQVPIFAFNLSATNDAIHIHNLAVNIKGTPTNTTTATATAAYLYNGSTQIASASINSTTGDAVFSNITDGTAGATVAAGSTGTFTVKADVTGVTAGSLALTGSFKASGTTLYNSQDSTIVATGSAAGQIQTVLGKGPAFTLISVTGPTYSAGTQQNQSSTSSLSATFNIQVQAIGADVLMGTQASATPAFTFGVYKGGTLTVQNTASSSSITLPSSGVSIDNTNKSFTIPQNTTVTLPVNFFFQGRTPAGSLIATDNYAIGVESAQWVTNGVAASTNFMSGQSAWRTGSVIMP